jgi:hypothetical protein
MSIHHMLPPSPPSSEGQASQPPQTPTTATQATQPQPAKRSSRRANTAERRATHNAVERARRETLNGRFLDLAAMLPNLAAVRRPSKSAIVNSSIALIHAQRRQRAIAARELRLIKAENDAIRQELNEWRARASLPRVEEPPRSTELIALLNLEDDPDMAEDEQRRAYEMCDAAYEDGEDFPEDNDDGYGPEVPQYTMYTQQAPPAVPAVPQPQRLAHLAAQQQAVFAQQQAAIARANQLQMAANNAIHHPVPQQATAAVQIPQSFDASLFADLGDNAYGQMFSPTAPQPTQSQWGQANNALITPPGSCHAPKSSSFATTANHGFLTSYNQGVNLNLFNATSFMAGNLSGGEDDTNSIGSSHGHESGHFASGSPASIGSSPVDHQFAYSTGATTFVQHQHQQQRRPSINIPGQAFSSSKQASPYHQGAPFAGMGLVM